MRALLRFCGAAPLLLVGCVGIQTMGPADFVDTLATNLPSLVGKPDGTYRGSSTIVLPAGAFAVFRSFTVDVHVASGRMTAIDLVQPEVMRTAEFFLVLPQQIVDRQSLDVDVVAGVTFSSQSFKKAVEHALSH